MLGFGSPGISTPYTGWFLASASTWGCHIDALNPAPDSSTTGVPSRCGRRACTRVVAVAVSRSSSSLGCGHRANARSYAAMNFARACSLTHEPGSPLAACISASWRSVAS